MRKLLLLQAVVLTHVLCFCQPPSDSTFTIRLTTAEATVSKQFFLAYQLNGRKIIDSAIEDNHTYIFHGKAGRPQVATIVADYNNLGLQQLIAATAKGIAIPMLKCYIHPGNIRIHTAEQLTDPEFTGSAINTQYLRLKYFLTAIESRQLLISRQLRATTDSVERGRLAQQLDSLTQKRKPVLKTFIQQHPDSYIALEALKEYAGFRPDTAIINPLFRQLSPQIRNTPSGSDYMQYLHNLTSLDSGATAPLFTQADTTGKPVSLSTFKGQYVLLHFWASWCGSCRADNPEIVRLYHDYKDRNFTILGISLDAADGRANWLQAIATDHLDWTQLSDLKHWNNSLVQQYGIGAIPQNYLIDPAGIIVAKAMNIKKIRSLLEKKLPQK